MDKFDKNKDNNEEELDIENNEIPNIENRSFDIFYENYIKDKEIINKIINNLETIHNKLIKSTQEITNNNSDINSKLDLLINNIINTKNNQINKDNNNINEKRSRINKKDNQKFLSRSQNINKIKILNNSNDNKYEDTKVVIKVIIKNLLKKVIL